MGNEAIALGIGALYLLSKGLINGNGNGNDKPNGSNVCDELNQERDEKLDYEARECNNKGGYHYFTTDESCGSYSSRCVICPSSYHHDPLTQRCESDTKPINDPCTAGQYRDTSGLCVDVPPSQSGCTPGCYQDEPYGDCVCGGIPTKEPEPESSPSCPNWCLEVGNSCVCHQDEPEPVPTAPTAPQQPDYIEESDPYEFDSPVKTVSPSQLRAEYPGGIEEYD
jgi:hypothetical protein